MSTTDLTITIPRSDLIQVLEDKKTALEAEWDAEIKRLTDERDNLPNTAKAVEAWYVEVAAMLAAGEARTTARGEIIAVDEDVKPVPQKPTTSGQRSTKQNLNHAIENAQHYKKSQVDKIDSSLRLLNLATNTDVVIPVSQYESLLSIGIGNIRHRF